MNPDPIQYLALRSTKSLTRKKLHLAHFIQNKVVVSRDSRVPWAIKSPAWIRMSPGGREGVALCVSEMHIMRIGGDLSYFEEELLNNNK